MAEYYRHYKGCVYRLVNIAKDSETQDIVVIYQAMYGDGDIWVRPYHMFFGKVDRDGKIQDRFAPISAAEALSTAPIELNPKYHFPVIHYQKEMPMMLNPNEGFSRGVKAMVSLLLRSQFVPEGFFNGLQNDDDVEKEALRRILSYKPGDDPVDIFHLIQTWGGSSGRGIYIFGAGFNWDALRPVYESFLNTCLATKSIDKDSINGLVQSVKDFDKSVDHLGISFITKHSRFWLYRTLGDNALPIYDSVMANEVMRQNTVSAKHLTEYWEVMAAKAKRLGISLMSLERQIFQYSLGTR